jgi:myo-inositol-1(or 4)-monophosphatase
MNQYIDFAKALSQEAEKILIRYFQAENIGLELKSDKSPVTLADTEVNALVISRVKERFPDHGVLGEEQSFNLDSKKLWIVDPLDGTWTFAHGLAGWDFSLAYAENGQVKVAVVLDPILRRLFWAAEGEGAYENDNKVEVNDSVPAGYLNVFSWTAGAVKGTLFKEPTTESKIIKAYNQQGRILVSSAPVAHMLALTGAGRIPATVSSCINPWDLAAGGFIAKEGGAKVTDLYGKPIERWDKNIKGILAAPPKNAEIIENIRD